MTDVVGGTNPEQLGIEFDQLVSAVALKPIPEAVESLRLKFLGRRGHVALLMESLRHCTKEERPLMGKAINELKQKVELQIAQLQTQAQRWALGQKLASPPLDITLPVGRPKGHGSLHPVTLMRRELNREFRRMGFTIYDGPEIDFERYNFNALNIPCDHPARDMQDTFYLASSASDDKLNADKDSRFLGRLLLRTHTSNTQIHAMLNERPPLRIVAPGRVFRVDSDPTHTPMFHQIEAFVVDKGITLGHLKGVISTFMKAIFGNQMKTRLRPSYFPFVEPGAEIDLQCVHCGGKGCRICKHTGWIEVGGAGMIHPNVFEAVEYDSDVYSGFAFGFGIDRMAMIKYSIPDLRQLFDGSVSYLSQYPVYL